MSLFRSLDRDLTTYSEAGFTVTEAESRFFRDYGAPGPSLQFSGLAGVTTDGEIRTFALGPDAEVWR